MSSSSNATFQYGFVQFGQPDYNLLLGIMFILVALGLIVVFTVKEAQSHHAKEVTPAAPTATVKEAPTVAPTSAAKPKKAAGIKLYSACNRIDSSNGHIVTLCK